MFVMGCPNHIVVTDHEPLKGLFGDRDLSKIPNHQLFRLKEKTLRYRFTIQHCLGKLHRSFDAISHNPAAILQTLPSVFPAEPSQSDITIFTNPSARAGYDTRSIFKRSLTGLNSEFSFS